MERRKSNDSSESDEQDQEQFGVKPSEELMGAAKIGDWTAISRLIYEGAQVEDTFLDEEEGSVNLLVVSSLYGHLECVKKLVDMGAKSGHRRAMMRAAERGRVDCFQFLMLSEFNGEVGNNERLAEIVNALKYGNFETIQTMVQKTDLKSFVREWGGPLLNVLIAHGCPTSCVQTLLDLGVDPNFKSPDSGLTSLDCSVYANNVSCVQFLCQKGVRLDNIDRVPLSPDIDCLKEIIHCLAKEQVMCYKDWVTCVEKTSSMTILLEYVEQIDLKDKSGMTLLMWACQKRSLKWAELLLERGADPNVQSCRGDTALTIACNKDHYKMVELLLKYKVDVNKQFVSVTPTDLIENPKQCMVRKLYDPSAEMGFCSLGDNALFIASRKGLDDILDLLLKHNVNVFVVSPQRFTAIMVAAVYKKINCVRKLIEHFSPVNHKNEDGQTALMLSCALGCVEVVDVLLKHGADVYGQDNTGRTPLMFAAAVSENGLECAQLLLERRANVHSRNKKGRTALMISCAAVNEQVFDLLIKHGSDVNARNVKGRSSVMYAAVNESISCVKKLLDLGADIDARTQDGDTALMLCCMKGMEEMVDFLIKNKANVNARNNSGKSAVILTSLGDDVDASTRILPKLVESGANIDIRTNNEDTALMFACTTGRIEIVEVLLKCKADVNAINKDGSCAILFATNENSAACVQKLIDAGASLDIADSDWTSVFSIAMGRDPDLFKLLIDSGRLCDENGLKRVHGDAITQGGPRFCLKNLLLTIERGIFDWHWCSVVPSTRVVIQAAVVSGISPGTFDLTNVCLIVSPLFASYIIDDVPLLTYVLSNLYFLPEHLKRLFEFPKFRDCHNTDLARDVDKVIVQKLLSKPLRLQAWSFLAVSKAISLSHAGVLNSRAALVNQLPLPDGMKRALKFQTLLRQACFDDLVVEEENNAAGDLFFSRLTELSSDDDDKYCRHCAGCADRANGDEEWETASDDSD